MSYSLTRQPDRGGPSPRGVAADARRGITGPQTPNWFRALGAGAGAWLALGIAGVPALAVFLIVLAVRLNAVVGGKTNSEV